MPRTDGLRPFAVLLQQYRAEAGLSQEELAERTALSRRGISDLERGERRSPHPSTVRQLAEALNLSPTERAALQASAHAVANAPWGNVQTAAPFPVSLTSFVGREREVAEVQRLLNSTQLLTLTGAGGMGKTRLALRAAADAQPGFADGVWLVRLDTVTDPALLPAAVSSVIGTGGGPAVSAVDAVVDAVGSRQLLLLLDNCEHLVHACAEFVEVLLEHCPALRILATSREVLGVPGEVVWPVPPLSLPKPTRPRQFTDSEAVRLFVERARAANPRFAVTDQNLTALVEVCRNLEGLLLAIELAAARTRLLSLEQMASRLVAPLQLLAGGSRTALPRQQTLRNTIEWSYDLLTEREQALFCRLSVFVGGWTIEAAERVCTGSPIVEHEVLHLLGRLVDTSLVMAQQDGVSEPRYRLLETLRAYAGERLAASRDDERTLSRYVDYFIEIGEEAHVHLNGGPKYAYWLQKLEAEKENLLAALHWALERHEQDRGLRLGGALWRFWFARRSLSEAREWLTQWWGYCLDIRARQLEQEHSTAPGSC